MGKNEDDTDYGWRRTNNIRWAKITSSMRDLEQLWENAAGDQQWRKVPWHPDEVESRP